MSTSQTPSVPSADSPNNPAPSIDAVRATVTQDFPHLWGGTEAFFSTAAALRLKNNDNCQATTLIGASSSGKGTISRFFDGHAMTYRSDNFTKASFVSQAANRKPKDLDKIDLLPKIKGKVLLTAELAPLFRGKDVELAERFAIITRVLDGQGLILDGGTQGQRGYVGDYRFAWFGCTTPLPLAVWEVMAQLGSRLLFYDLGDGQDVTEDDLLEIDEGVPYRARVETCRAVVHAFLTQLFDKGVHNVEWNPEGDSENVRKWIARFAKLLAAGRTVLPKYGDECHNCSSEDPKRAYALLSNLARGRAIVYGRRQLTHEDLPLVAHVTLSSMPSRRGQLLRALASTGESGLTVSDAQTVLGVGSHHTAENEMDTLVQLEIAVWDTTAKSKVIRPREKWAWLITSECATLVGKFAGVCAAYHVASPKLVKPDRRKKKEKVEFPFTHPPETANSDLSAVVPESHLPSPARQPHGFGPTLTA